MRDCNKCPGPGFDPTEQTGPVYLGGVLGIDVNGVRQPIDAEGIVELQVDAQAAADSAAEALRWAQQSATNAQQARANAEITNTMLGLAKQAATDAEVSASDAEGSATDAAGSATQAAGSATAAAASAAAAQTAAERDVPAAAAAWLAEHVDPSTGYVLDDSLTIQGAAADAKAVGDELKTVKSQLLLDANSGVDYSTLLGTADFPLGWRTGSYGSTDGAATGSARYIRTVTGGSAEIVAPPHAVKVIASAPEGKYIAISEYDQNGTYITRHGVPNDNSGTGTRTVETDATPGHIYKLTVGMTETGVDSSTWLTAEIINQISLTFSEERPKSPDLLQGDLSSYTIVCAKETNYDDGTSPTVEWYLILSPKKDFYLTKDFQTAQYLFTAVDYNPFVYKYAVLKNGDIIAVARVEQISSGSSEDNRKNPFVYLVSESWSIKHTVDFGSGLKPCGWLENCGFCSMPNGDAMFCEYTRPSVVTANCWKIHGDPTSAASWTVVKSFELSGLPNEGFKHCHAVNYDFYHGVYYLCTGDDDVGAQVWYSTDSGVSWTLAREPSEKYCRALNMIFTPDYIYWASDSSKAAHHYLFRAERNANGVLDYSTVVELKNLYVYGVATYGLVYLEELNALVILDKADAELESIPLRIYDISSGELITVATLVTTDGQSRNIGFRTEYSEFIPNGNYVLCGFGKTLGLATYRNYIRGLGNSGVSNKWMDYVNNLKIYIYKTSSGFGCRFRTAFMP